MLRKPYLVLAAIILLALLSSCQTPDAGHETLPALNTQTLSPAQIVPAIENTPETQPTNTPTHQPAPDIDEQGCQDSAGEIQAYEISWRGEILNGRIYTPPCYPNDDRQYPTLYLLHGATETEEQWETLGLFDLTDDLIDKGKIPALIIVMPREDTWVSLQENPYGDQLVQALIPWVDDEFQTLAERNYRAVGGLSRGGNWAIRLGLMHWGAFGSFAGHSAPLFYGDLNRLPGWLEDIPAGSIPRIYLDIAEGDRNLAESESLREILEKADVSLEWHLYPGLHDGNYWSSHLAEYLLWYSADWSDLKH